MSFEYIAFPEGEEPYKDTIDDLLPGAPFKINGNWELRRFGVFEISKPGEIVEYLYAHSGKDKPGDSVIKKAILSLNPEPYKR
ncbi:hypothetical protein NM551_004003 [Enterobacter hormaechei]|nr:hypothetical protein [Enterobacter hormaechei]HAV1906113.1 hypothetical protein [Enterobacter hormaechei subsp. steigerwaltii]HAV1958439.1 hypothetical protein [Enterobacter hormaechei subsp. steigerwaltii]